MQKYKPMEDFISPPMVFPKQRKQNIKIFPSTNKVSQHRMWEPGEIMDFLESGPSRSGQVSSLY